MIKRKSICILSALIVLIMAVCLALPAFAEGGDTAAPQTENKMTLYNDPDGRLMCVAKQGAVSVYPENSLEGITYALANGADMVEIDVRKTSDGVLVLMKDEDFSRMCVDPSGNTITGKVSETESWEVIGMSLRQGRGGEANAPTECNPHTLEDVINTVGTTGVLLINFDWEIRDDVYETVKSLGAFSRVIFKVNGEKNSVFRFVKKTENDLLEVMSGYNGNIVFSARSYVKKSEKAELSSVMLSVKNPYGVVFHRSVLALFDGNARAAVDMTDPALCGGRADDEVGWNDLASKGYSIIETDYPEKLGAYIKELESEKSALSSLVEKAKGIDRSSLSAASVKALDRQIASSEKLLSVHTSKQELNEQYYRLNTAVLGIEAGDGSATTITAGRIIAAVFVTALFVGAEVIVYRHSRKNDF